MKILLRLAAEAFALIYRLILPGLLVCLAACATSAQDQLQGDRAPPDHSAEPASVSAPTTAAIPTPAPQKSEPDDFIFPIEGGSVFVPAYMLKEPSLSLVVIHFHGSSNLLRAAFKAAGIRGALVTVERKGLSAAYTRVMSRRGAFRKLLDRAMKEVSSQKELPKFPAGQGPRLMVSSFSAGFGAVREILSSPDSLKRVQYLSMVDSLHAGFIEQPKRRVLKRIIDEDLMKGFLTYARRAAAGKAHMLITHTAIQPVDYASTTETSDYLLSKIRGTRADCKESFAKYWAPASCVAVGRLTIVGYPGEEAPDHIEQLHHMEHFFRYWKDILDAVPGGRA